MDFSNCTEGFFSLDDGSEEVSIIPPSKILLTFTLSLLAVMTTAINSLVITAIIVTRKLHHPANYLICSLAVTDLLVAILVMPFSILYIQRESWQMGEAVCYMWLSVDITCCTCSILHLAAIALDRYRAITDAVEYSRKRTGLRAGITVGVVWFLSILISLPPLLWRNHGGEPKEDHCLITHHHIVFTLYSTLGAFYIPLLLILILYYKIYRAAQTLYLRRGASRGASRASRHSSMVNGTTLPSCPPDGGPDTLNLQEKSYSDPTTEGDRVRITVKSPHSESRRERECSLRRQRISGTRERRAASTLGLILGAFVVCWLPFFLKEVIVNTCGSCSTSIELADFLTWLGYLNSLINPLIYTIFNEDFKKAFQRLVRCRHRL
ncbi:5-hydroxytryptamine receptor 1F-like [Oncorhynchus clarkii lewisi]|uniref:5-hydroxytryptamine receptor 1F-like n=1 Tax=Oncorhynchus clarkii lewisi TaxID=490388 RepID=UPI0039B8D965